MAVSIAEELCYKVADDENANCAHKECYRWQRKYVICFIPMLALSVLDQADRAWVQRAVD